MSLKEESHPEWLFGANPRAIEEQEARGQEKLIKSELVPSEIRGKEKFEALGFEFGDPIQDDPLFCRAKFPKGFSMRATNHPMWSEIIDSECRAIADVFYKAAFYDRGAWMAFKN